MDEKPCIENAADSAAKTHAKQILIPTLGNIINRHKEIHKAVGDVNDTECLDAQTSSKSQFSVENEEENRQHGVVQGNDKPIIPVSKPPLPKKPVHNFKPEITDSKPVSANDGKDEFHANDEDKVDNKPSSDDGSAKQEQKGDITADMFLQSTERNELKNSDGHVTIASGTVDECGNECDNNYSRTGQKTDFTITDSANGHVRDIDIREEDENIPPGSVKETIVQQNCHADRIDDLSIVNCNEQNTSDAIAEHNSGEDQESTDILKASPKSQILEHSEINLKKQEITGRHYVDSNEEPHDIKPNNTFQNARAPEMAHPVQPDVTFKPKPRRPPPLPPSALQHRTSQPVLAPKPPSRDTALNKNEQDVPKLEAASFENSTHHGFTNSRDAVKRKPMENSDYVRNIAKTIEHNKKVSGSPDFSVTGSRNVKKDRVTNTKDEFSHIKAIYDTPSAIAKDKEVDNKSVPEVKGPFVKNKARFTGSIFKKHGGQKEGIVAKKKAEYDENLKKDMNEVKEERSRKPIKEMFVKKRNKGHLKEVQEERKSCPPSMLNYQKELDGRQPPESKLQDKSLTSAQLPVKEQPKEPESELMRRLHLQRQKTDDIKDNGHMQTVHEAKPVATTEEIDEKMEDAVFFDYVLVVKLQQGDNGLEPYISFRFPPKQKYDKEMDPRVASIPQFCFPYLKDGMSASDYREQHAGYSTSETFSFVLTDMVGQRHFGYCRQIQVKDKSKKSTAFQLPEVYCIISPFGLFGLYSQILDEVERQCAYSSSSVFVFLKAVLSHSLPRPGRSIQVSFYSGGSGGISSFTLTREGDFAVHEHVDLKLLFERLQISTILSIVSALLLERRIILASSQLSLLSSCCHGFISLLYPFTWQHTYIPVLPFKLVDMCCLPTPYLLGMLSGCLEEIEDLPIDEAMIVDLDKGEVLRVVFGRGFLQEISHIYGRNEPLKPIDDENSSKFPTAIESMIQELLDKTLKDKSEQLALSGNKERNLIITEVFIDAYLQLIGNFQGYYSHGNENVFENIQFYKAAKSKEHRKFLKEFVKTQAFQQFIREHKKQPSGKGLFQERMIEWEKSRKNKGSASAWHKMKGKFKR